jgi:tRNA (cmo5U34)-methyltransferase
MPPAEKDTKTHTSADAGDSILANRAHWSFGGEVPKRFVEHIRRSVPMYDEGHALVCQLSDFFLRSDSLCYEIGTSTGELMARLVDHNRHKTGIQFVGLDNEPAMIEAATGRQRPGDPVSFELTDIVFKELDPCDLIVAYYTMQFIAPKFRQAVLNKLYEALEWGGALILFEKVRGPDARFQDINNQLYTAFKRGNGFTGEEILNKSESLKGILEPFSTEGNLDLLRRAGFQDIQTVFKYVCFEGFLCIK